MDSEEAWLRDVLERAGNHPRAIDEAVADCREYGLLSALVDGHHPPTIPEVRRPYVYRRHGTDVARAEEARTRLDRQWAYSDEAEDWVRRHHGNKRVGAWRRQRDGQQAEPEQEPEALPEPEPELPEAEPAVLPVTELRERYRERDREKRRDTERARQLSASPSPLGQPQPSVEPSTNGHKPPERCGRCGYLRNSIGHTVVCDDD